MSDFNDLVFKRHESMGGRHATLYFDNGYGVSVVNGPMFYTSVSKPYELAVMYNGDLCYDSGITDDVLGYLTEDDVTKYIQEVEQLPPKN